jgi:hypothetical protein
MAPQMRSTPSRRLLIEVQAGQATPRIVTDLNRERRWSPLDATKNTLVHRL